jgi:rRNA maturation endonuclease Nob1
MAEFADAEQQLMMDPFASETENTLLCIACGYDLRELSEEGECPECGLPIERSPSSDNSRKS